MCYGMMCMYERSDGSCSKPRGEDCPTDEDFFLSEDERVERYKELQEIKRLMSITHGHPAQEPFEPGLDYALIDYVENTGGCHGYADAI